MRGWIGLALVLVAVAATAQRIWEGPYAHPPLPPCVTVRFEHRGALAEVAICGEAVDGEVGHLLANLCAP